MTLNNLLMDKVINHDSFVKKKEFQQKYEWKVLIFKFSILKAEI